MVKLDQLFENIYKLEYFSVWCAANSLSMFKKDTCKKLAGILPGSKEPSEFSLFDLTEEFDLTTITDFLLKNENIFICLDFGKDIPLSDAYKEILESFIAKIIKTPPKMIPAIYFPGFENSVFHDDYRKLYDSRK